MGTFAYTNAPLYMDSCTGMLACTHVCSACFLAIVRLTVMGHCRWKTAHQKAHKWSQGSTRSLGGGGGGGVSSENVLKVHENMVYGAIPLLHALILRRNAPKHNRHFSSVALKPAYLHLEATALSDRTYETRCIKILLHMHTFPSTYKQAGSVCRSDVPLQ